MTEQEIKAPELMEKARLFLLKNTNGVFQQTKKNNPSLAAAMQAHFAIALEKSEDSAIVLNSLDVLNGWDPVEKHHYFIEAKTNEEKLKLFKDNNRSFVSKVFKELLHRGREFGDKGADLAIEHAAVSVVSLGVTAWASVGVPCVAHALSFGFHVSEGLSAWPLTVANAAWIAAKAYATLATPPKILKKIEGNDKSMFMLPSEQKAYAAGPATPALEKKLKEKSLKRMQDVVGDLDGTGLARIHDFSIEKLSAFVEQYDSQILRDAKGLTREEKNKRIGLLVDRMENRDSFSSAVENVRARSVGAVASAVGSVEDAKKKAMGKAIQSAKGLATDVAHEIAGLGGLGGLGSRLNMRRASNTNAATDVPDPSKRPGLG